MKCILKVFYFHEIVTNNVLKSCLKEMSLQALEGLLKI